MSVDPIAAEARAVESGAHAMQQADGTFRVRSFSTPGTRYIVRPGITKRHGRQAIILSCSCPSGSARPSELVPCQHAALVARRLERLGWAEWDSGFWWATDVALDAAGIERPKVSRIARGLCPICSAFVSVKLTAETKDVRGLAAAHRPTCAATYAKRKANAKDAPEVDLYDRT